MAILKSYLPEASILKTQHKKYDYVDSFESVFTNKNNSVTPQNVAKAFFTSEPKWIKKLMAVRNNIVSIFGLKTSGRAIARHKQFERFKCAPGERIGLFKVFGKTENEVVIGQDDKHLNFRVSLLLTQNGSDFQKKNLIISTTVEFNNWLGRLYFLLLKPFHKIIVQAMLKRIIKQLEKQN